MCNNSLSIDCLKYEYLNKNSIYNLEKGIIESFSKEEYLSFINEYKKSVYLSKRFYLIKRNNHLKTVNYSKLTDIEKYFIEQCYYYFHGGLEIEQNEKIISKLTTYYKLYYVQDFGNKFINVSDVSIEKVISMYIKLPKNINKNISCPFHNERSPSFRIYTKTNSFYCFGCLKSGNAINFISEFEKITTKEAYKKLLKIYN